MKVIAFDFDGTLADSVELCLAVFDRVLRAHLGDAAPSRDEVLSIFGVNEPGILRRYLGDAAPAAEREFYRILRELHPVMCPDVMPGVRELLESLRRRVPLVLLTGRCETTGRIALECLRLDGYFSAFRFGSAECNAKAAQLRALPGDFGVDPGELCYVGDAVSDVRACREAGIRCLSAAWSSSAWTRELEEVNPGLVFPSVAALRDYLEARLPAEDRRICDPNQAKQG